MRPMKNGILIAAALVSTLLGACSGNKDCSRPCAAPMTCDKGDGVCKCGGRGGVVCAEGHECQAETNTCVTVKCGSVTCSNGTSCDGNDGKCKCGGTDGTVCAAGQVCNAKAKVCAVPADCSQIACPRNQSCDPASGQCFCGQAACPAGKTCAVAQDGSRTCVDNLCAGVTCTGSNTCDPSDGLCKCNGSPCQTGEACACPGDAASCLASARACAPSVLCVSKVCPDTQTCDPTDGQCKCGGPGAPACHPEQVCSNSPPWQCQGGQLCENSDGSPKVCAAGLSCDPEDGKCKCGGRGGAVCQAPEGFDPGEVCVSSAFQKVCRRPCDPLSPDCGPGTYCFYDATLATPVAYCATPTDSRPVAGQCVSPTACFSENPSLAGHCAGLGQGGGSGVCRTYCNVSAGPSGCPQNVSAQTCVQITGGPAGLGYCQPS